jgi:hypothetical protein
VGRQRIYTIHRHRPELNGIETFHSPGKWMVCLDFAVALPERPELNRAAFERQAEPLGRDQTVYKGLTR